MYNLWCHSAYAPGAVPVRRKSFFVEMGILYEEDLDLAFDLELVLHLNLMLDVDLVLKLDLVLVLDFETNKWLTPFCGWHGYNMFMDVLVGNVLNNMGHCGH